MFKKWHTVLSLVLICALLFTGCSLIKKEASVPTQTMSISEFESLLSGQPLVVTKTKYTVQDEEHKALYPDLLQAIITSNTTADIKNAVVAFAAWDSNNLPVKIKGQLDISGSYIQQVGYEDINLVSGGSFGNDQGFSLAEDNNIASFKAIVVSYEAFDGAKWENPYFDEFRKLYEGKKYSDGLTVEVAVEESTVPTISNQVTAPIASVQTAAELDVLLSQQPVFVTKTNYLVQDEQYKNLYPDLLQAVFQNNTDTDIKNVVIAFAAWDEANLPVKIKCQFDLSAGAYIQKASYDDVNLTPGGTYGADDGLALDPECKIAVFKAIVESYETSDGQTWTNPHYDDFCLLYEGQKLVS